MAVRHGHSAHRKPPCTDIAKIHCQISSMLINMWPPSQDQTTDQCFTYPISLLTHFAGLSSEEKLHGVKYITESFVGCIRNVVLSSGKAASDLLPIAPLVATKHENVNEGCSDMCESRHNLCFVGSRCINHYGGISCDCFGTHYEGEHCDIYSEYLSVTISIFLMFN